MKILLVSTAIIGAIIVFFALSNWWTRHHPQQLSKADIAKAIENFLNNSGGAYDWDDFLTFTIADPELDLIRRRCVEIEWKTDTGREQLKEELQGLRN